MGIRLGALEHGATHRKRVREILEATGVFTDEEVDVGIEVFDERARSESACGVGAPHASNETPRELREAQLPPYEYVGAFSDDGELVGYACYGATPGTDRTYDLYWIAVHPEQQGTGGGTALLARVEGELRERNARLVVVETSSRPAYEPTRRFYERRGYAVAARMRDFYAPGDDRLIFTKRFT